MCSKRRLKVSAQSLGALAPEVDRGGPESTQKKSSWQWRALPSCCGLTRRLWQTKVLGKWSLKPCATLSQGTCSRTDVSPSPSGVFDASSEDTRDASGTLGNGVAFRSVMDGPKDLGELAALGRCCGGPELRGH